jgi:hypothetical protein
MAAQGLLVDTTTTFLSSFFQNIAKKEKKVKKTKTKKKEVKE